MGYDMRIKGDVPSAPQEQIDAALVAYNAADREHGRRAHAAREAGDPMGEVYEKFDELVAPLWDAYRRLMDPGYFRLNIWGMGSYRSAMADLGMAHDSESLDIKWPDYPDDESDESAMAEYETARDYLLAHHGESNNPSIPLHKLGSNDGWLVTPDEIRVALDAWQSRDESSLTAETRERIQSDYWGKWIKYLELAVDHGGFQVH